MEQGLRSFHISGTKKRCYGTCSDIAFIVIGIL